MKGSASLAVCLAAALAMWSAGLSRADDAELAKQIAELVERLDSDRFEVRSRAADELESLLKRPEAAGELAAQFARTLANPAASFEVRSQLQAWLKRLPASDVDIPVEPAAVEELLELAIGDSFSQRAGAIQQLKALAAKPASAIALMAKLRQRLSDSGLPQADYEQLLQLERHARGVWLVSDPASWKFPEATNAEIAGTVGELAQAVPASRMQGGFRPHAAARRYLLDLLCQDALIPRVKAALETALTNPAVDFEGRARLSEMLDWTRPALVAEIWQNRRHIAEQHLLVDVPRQSMGATRPSHFSRIDDRTAWCASGQNLKPGEYPVGVAIAHPERPSWMCHLVNLPTPIRRMRYSFHVQRDEDLRLAELTERTLRTYTADRSYLNDLEILLFHELHPTTVSRLVGDYFLAVDDRRQEQGAFNLGGINVSHHGRMCYVLSLMGTRDAAPALLEALRKQRFLPPVAGDAPYDWPWIAALAIAERDPWPEVDAWLASLLDRREPLVVGRDVDDDTDRKQREANAKFGPPELGASAAAMLLDRHQQTPETFGLETVANSVLGNAGCPAYRYSSPTGRPQVLQWWESQRRQASQREKAP